MGTLSLWFFFSVLLVWKMGPLSCCVFVEHACPNANISFWLYHRNIQNDPLKLDVFNMNTINRSLFNENPIKILIHGYTDSRDVGINPTIRPVYFQRTNYNIIALDFNPIVRNPCYVQAVFNTEVVANCTAQLIDHLVQNANVSLEHIHILGHSLGAHVSGAIQKYLTVGLLRRITGLDPAGPFFEMPVKVKSGLNRDDAKFVDVIHTNSFQRGKYAAIGHVDFYVNGGVSQPGCQNTKDSSSCSHQKVLTYYAESITTDVGFWGRKYESVFQYWLHRNSSLEVVEIMGEFTPETARGVYFVDTNVRPPYAVGKPEEY